MKNLFKVWVLAIALAFGTVQTFGQFTWTKDARNPVLSGGAGGAWNYHVAEPCVLFNTDSTRYEMWFIGFSGAVGNGDYHPYNIGFASSRDGITWDMNPSPVLSPTPGTWDEYTVDAPMVIRQYGQYKMWYTSFLSPISPDYLGYATSADGIHWTKYSGNPVMGPGNAAWEVAGPYGCSVMPVRGGYKMWYAGVDATFLVDNIGYATSADGVVWVKDSVSNPVLKMGAPGQWDDGFVGTPQVLVMDNTYYMWYTGLRTFTGPRAVGVATSNDTGKTWTRYVGNPVLQPSGVGWDGSWTEGGSVLQRGDTLDMWYDGDVSPVSLNRFRIGHATSALPGFAQQNWELQNSNFPPDVSVVSLSAVNSQVCWAAGQKRPPNTIPYSGYIRTTNGGTNWICDSIPGAEGGFLAQIVALDANTAYATVFVTSASNSKGVYKTTDGGAIWTKQNAYASSSIGPGYIHFFDGNNGVVIGDPNLETYTTTNGGLNWNAVSMPPALAGEYTKLSDAGIASAGNRVWFSTSAHIFRSTDRGYTWSASPSEPQYLTWYPCIAFQDSNTGIYSLKLAPGGLDHHYRKTTDGGVTWNTLSNSIIDNIAPTSIQYLPGSGATYLLSGGMPQGERGFAVTYDAGGHWKLIDTSGHLGITFSSESVGWGGGIAYVTNDVYKYVGLPLSVEDEIAGPATYHLAQNYPNPFNPSTTIRFELPKASQVTLSVFDILGREVSELVNEKRNAGVYEVRFDGLNLASGVYFYRLQAGTYVETKKFLLLR